MVMKNYSLNSRLFAIFSVVLLTFLFSDIFSQVNWTRSTTFHSRVLNSIGIVDFSKACIVGGNKTNDSIQTILLTTDGGNIWNHLSDNIMPWLTSVCYSSPGNCIAVGDYGKIIRSTNGGSNWSTITVTGSLNQRNFNSVFFTDNLTGFIAGGNPAISYRTILKTTNGGSSWTTVLDENGTTLNSIFFINQNIGWTVGDSGCLLKTTDGGTSWNQITIPGNPGIRNFRTVFFTSELNGFIAGGNYNNNVQTLLTTTDGGSTWSIIKDETGNILNDIYFINSSTGYAVGKSGTAIETNDGGITWTTINLPANDFTNDFNSVRFVNLDFGYIAGTGGIVYKYYNPAGHTPTVVTNTANNQHDNSITLNGSVNANGYFTSVSFDYGTSMNYDNSIIASPSPVFDYINFEVSAVLSGLIPNTLYHYRIKAVNPSGTSYGADMQFYNGLPLIPNFDFESWDTTSAIFPTGYDLVGGNISRIETPCNGNYAVLLLNDTAYDKPAAMMMGLTNDLINFEGGLPYSSKPDSIKGCFDYSISPGDSGVIYLIFKNNNQIISQNVYKIWGNSGGSYQNLSFPIIYSDSILIPDTVIFGICASTFIVLDSIIPGNYIALDNITFSGTNENIVNNDFEDWTQFDKITLNNWEYEKINSNTFSLLPVEISETHHYGLYSALLRSYVEEFDTLRGSMQSAMFEINYSPKKITGFYQFYPLNNDSLVVTITVFSQGQVVGQGRFTTGDSTSWFTPFEAIIDYSLFNTPDSAYITISTYTDITPLGNSYALIDNLNFDSFLLDIGEIFQDETQEQFLSFYIYPNPANDFVNICMNSTDSRSLEIQITDLLGKKILTDYISKTGSDCSLLTIQTRDICPGIYIVTVQDGKHCSNKKLIIHH